MGNGVIRGGMTELVLMMLALVAGGTECLRASDHPVVTIRVYDYAQTADSRLDRAQALVTRIYSAARKLPRLIHSS